MWFALWWKMKKWQPCNFFVRHLAASKKKVSIFGQELSFCQFPSGSEKVVLEDVTLHFIYQLKNFDFYGLFGGFKDFLTFSVISC
jgi:hypothetical protein